MNKQFLPILTPTQQSLLKLAGNYDRDIESLTERIDFIKEEIAALPCPTELKKLQARLEILYCERRDMRQTSARLKKLAAPKTPSPSLLARERYCFKDCEAS